MKEESKQAVGSNSSGSDSAKDEPQSYELTPE